VLTLLPEKNVGFVVLINGDGGEARAVLSQALVKRYSAPDEDVDIAKLADELARDRGPAAARKPTEAKREPVRPRDAPAWAGVYEDAWFGSVSICPEGRKVIFAAQKSPRLKGTVLRVGERLLVDWDDASVDAEPWLDFTAADDAQPMTLALSHVDPEADFSYDYPDLAFKWVGACKASRRASR